MLFKKFWLQEQCGPKTFTREKKGLIQKRFGTNKFFDSKNIQVKKSKKIWIQTKYWSKKYLGQKKFCQKKVASQKLRPQKKLDPKSTVKIGSDTSQIYLRYTGDNSKRCTKYFS